MLDPLMNTGDTVEFGSRKGALIRGVITDIKWGRKYSHLSITDTTGHLWGYRITSQNYKDTPSLKFISKANSKQLAVAVEKRNELENKLYEKKRENTDRLFKEKVAPGDTIVVRGSHGNWEAEVDEVNYREGKVGIRRKNFGFIGGDDLSILYSRRKARTHRWIAMNFIVEVKKGKGITSQNIKSVPEQVKESLKKDRYSNELSAKGHVQIKYSNGEFISSSYAVAKEKHPIEMLANRRVGRYEGMSMLDSGDETVKFDKDLNLYWIDTGCFD